MSHEVFDFSKKFTMPVLKRFAQVLMNMQARIPFKVSSRGWCYLMEQAGYIDKSQFDKVDSAVNRLRKEGMIPVNFVAEESARMFANVETPNVHQHKGESLEDVMKRMLKDVLDGDRFYTPDWWEGEEYYIQMLVEKIDLKTLFQPICRQYHIPIANAKGWSSILQRAEYARRFKDAEERGLKCVLLYCGDHDPDGLRISDTIRKNLYDLQKVRWNTNERGYDPTNLEIHRFGLNYDFIAQNGYTWIDNLVTGSGSELAKIDEEGNVVAGKIAKGKRTGEDHQNFQLPYLQNYIKQFGVRKCEANAIVTTPDAAVQLCRDEIERWLGDEALERFQAKRIRLKNDYNEMLQETGLIKAIQTTLGSDYEGDEEDGDMDDDFSD